MKNARFALEAGGMMEENQKINTIFYTRWTAALGVNF